MIGHALDDNAFMSEHLMTAANVFAVKNRPPVQCTPLRWKDEWLKRPVFRRTSSLGVSEDEALLYQTLCDDVKNQSLDAGMEEALTARAWRRWRANNLNGTLDTAAKQRSMLTRK